MGGKIIILCRMQQQCRWMLVPLCSVTKPKTERGSKLMDVEGGLAAELLACAHFCSSSRRSVVLSLRLRRRS